LEGFSKQKAAVRDSVARKRSLGNFLVKGRARVQRKISDLLKRGGGGRTSFSVRKEEDARQRGRKFVFSFSTSTLLLRKRKEKKAPPNGGGKSGYTLGKGKGAVFRPLTQAASREKRVRVRRERTSPANSNAKKKNVRYYPSKGVSNCYHKRESRSS